MSDASENHIVSTNAIFACGDVMASIDNDECSNGGLFFSMRVYSLLLGQLWKPASVREVCQHVVGMWLDRKVQGTS